ncbi:MAG: CBS domain-containing protein, partial [Mariprofundaceae bacterium]|nr:CBS domain-containing protein [Mariprofundaceae bacterium]
QNMDANTVTTITPLHIAFQDGGNHVRAVLDGDKVVGILLMRHLLEQAASGHDIYSLAARDVMETTVISLTQSNNGLHIARLFFQHHMKSLVMLDKHGAFVHHMNAQEAIANLPRSLLGFFQPVQNMMIKHPKTTLAHATLMQVLETWLLTPVSCLIVCDELGHPEGMLSESDILQWILAGRPKAKVQDYMNSPIVTMPENSSLGQVWEAMQCNHVSKMGITHQHGVLSGLVTATDILVALCASQLETFAQYTCPDDVDIMLEWSKGGMVMAVKDSIVKRFGFANDELVGLHWQEGCQAPVVAELLRLKPNETMDILWEVDGAALPFTANRDAEQAIMYWRLKA